MACRRSMDLSAVLERRLSRRVVRHAGAELARHGRAVSCGAVRRQAKLNDLQLAVLRRIGAGDDPVTARNPELARTVYALRDRRLVTTPRTDGVWVAHITDAGRFYLEHGRHPGLPAPSSATPTPATSLRTNTAGQAHGGEDLLALGQELITRVQDNGGTLRIDDPDADTRAAYRRVIHAVKQHGLVPAGFQLRHTGRNAGDLIIQLADDAHLDETEWNRIRLGVRDRVSEAPALTRLLRDNPGVLDVSDPVLPRALEIVEALAEHARRRGHKLAMSRKKKHQGLYLLVGEHRCTVTVTEEHDQVPRDPAAGATAARKVYAWQRVPQEFDAVASGRLRVQLPESPHGRRDHWSDDGRSRLENKLLEVIKEVEHRTAAAEQAHRERQREHELWLAEQEREKAEKRARWEAAMQQARTRAVDAHRQATFGEALHRWQAATDIRAFCDALEQAATAEQTGGDAGELPAWIAWGRDAADSLDPTRNPAPLAQAGFDRPPLPDELRPYLGEWSPHRPEKEYRPRPPISPSSVSEVSDPWIPGRQGRAQWWRR